MILTSQNLSQHPQHQHNPYENSVQGNKRRVYVLLFISLMQPFFMWWLTRHLVAVNTTNSINSITISE
jgi:hypothetical protein